jgi:hypothetical protein
VLQPGEANLRQRTYFSFWWSSDLDVNTLEMAGNLKGRLDGTRLHEIQEAIRTSKRLILKRLIGC